MRKVHIEDDLVRSSVLDMSSTIRFAKVRDAAAMIDFYGPLISDTAISFETRPLTLEALEVRMRSIMAKYPWLVCEIDGSIAGFSYAGPHRSRPGYLWSVETSIYVSAEFRRRGVGLGLYQSLLALLDVQGYQMAYAGITVPNEASMELHRSLGFEEIGVYRNAGFKLDSWHDASWWQRQIGGSLPENPSPPLTPDEASTRAPQEWAAALQSGLDSIK